MNVAIVSIPKLRTNMTVGLTILSLVGKKLIGS